MATDASSLVVKGIQTFEVAIRQDSRSVAYLSAEFLPGPHLANNLLNLGITDSVRQALDELGLNLDDIIEQEEEPGLGNGGLGRLASCFLDSMVSLGVRALGYGIRYEFGIFDQTICDGWQFEVTDKWLRFGNPWEIVRPEIAFDVPFGGSIEWMTDEGGQSRARWIPATVVKGMAYDTPIMGYRVNTCNPMRLLVDEHRMANLATVGSHHVKGVARGRGKLGRARWPGSTLKGGTRRLAM